MPPQFKYRRTYQLTDELNCLPQHNTLSLFLSFTFILPLSLWTQPSTHCHFSFWFQFFHLVSVSLFCFPNFTFMRFVFDILFFTCFWVCHLSSSVDFCLSRCFFFVLFEARCFFRSFFFYLTCTMWLSLFLWCIIISSPNKWTLHSRWQCRRSKEY